MRESGLNSASTAGYTLIELLITIAIIGIAVGVVTLSLRGDESRKLAEETDRLGALFRMAASEARTGGRSLVWEADRTGYRFRALVVDDTQPLPEELARERRWPVEVRDVERHEIVFAREPLREPAIVAIATKDGVLRLELDARGNLHAAGCEGAACAALR
jgi:general secretion pathway protein H